MASTVVGIMGAKRSGKDTLAGFLVEDHGYTRFAFADVLKAFCLSANPIISTGWRLADVVAASGWEDAKTLPEVRRFLQEAGLAAREHLGENVWVDRVMQSAHWVPGPVVITDVRFPNEVVAVRESRGLLVRVNRPGLTQDDSHVSESLAWDPRVVPDVTVANAGSLDALRGDAAWVANLAR